MRRKTFRKILLLAACLFLAGAADSYADQAYPQLNISGFKKWQYTKPDVSPARNYFTGLTYLGGYYPTFTGGPWQERLQLKIVGELSKDLSVTYDLEQQPETPDKFDVKVKYQNDELTFGDFNANFSGNEFVSASKYLNGVMLTAKDSWYDITAVPSAKLKSQTQSLTSQNGNNTRGPYNLGHGGIVEGSEQIQLNDTFLARNVDYTIDYFEGKITFNRILNTTDVIKYSYEYTNIIDLFFPTLSQKDFFGFQSRFTLNPDTFGRPAPKPEPVLNPARENFPTVGSAEPDMQEQESTGRYQLKYFPLVNFSETLTFMGSQLVRNQDYIIKYDTGEIKLLTRFLPSAQDQLTVDYTYYQTTTEVETIPGIGSRGPYRTDFSDISPQSEKIIVDGKQFVRDLDYSINYKTGEILFGLVISQTSQITVTYQHNVKALPPESAATISKEIKIGTTYLRESAKNNADSLTTTAIETYTGQNILTGNYLLKLQNRPILGSTEATITVMLKQGGTTRELTPEVEYVFPRTSIDPGTGYTVVTPSVPLAYITDRTDPTDGLGTGTLYFLNQNLSSSDEVTITYTYDRNIVGKYAGVGDGSRGPYYLRNTRSIVPGSETVQVWDQGSSVITTYTRNSSFDANAGDTGYSLNYNANNPSITFNSALPSTKNFQIIYQYVPNNTTSNNNISRSALGIDGDFKIGDFFKMDAAFAHSETDQVLTTVPTIETPPANGTKTITLHSPANILDGSEKVVVNQNTLNRDTDYFISYSAPGQISFYYITPSSLDAISVSYSYLTNPSSGGGQASVTNRTDNAYRLGAEAKAFGDALTFNGTTKKVGFDFTPLGSTAIGAGSEYQEYNVKLNPKIQSSYTNYTYRYNKTPIGTARDSFLYSYENTIGAGINPNNLLKMDFNYRNVQATDDPAKTIHNSDTKQETFSGSFVPADWHRGELTIGTKYDFSSTSSINDAVDKGPLYSKSTIDFRHFGTDLKFTDRFSLDYDYQVNLPVTLSGTQEIETVHGQATDSTYNFNADLTPAFLKKLAARISILDHQELHTLPTPESTSSTKNETFHLDVSPVAILTGTYDHSREERSSYTIGGVNPLTVRDAGTARLTPISWFSMGVNGSKNDAVPETGLANETIGRSLGGDVDYTPLQLTMLKLNSHFVVSNAYQVAPLGNERVKTTTDSLSKAFTLNLTFIPVLPINLGYTQEDYKNKNNSVTSPITTETQNITTQIDTTFSAIPLLTLTGSYNQKTTRDLINGLNPVKTLMNLKAAYQVTSWGTLNLEWERENNQGEIQAGALTSLNIERETVNRSLNVTIPVDNPAISSFVLQASWKSVNYKNKANASGNDDFYAQLVSFEGTLNF